MNINFLKSEYFEYKFKRSPKFWTIEQLYDLYLRTLERTNKRREVLKSIQSEIVKEITPNGGKEYITYFYTFKNYKNKKIGELSDQIHKYTFSWVEKWKCYGSHENIVRFDKSVSENRDEKLQLILSNEKAFELGQKYYYARRMESYLDRYVHNVMWEVIESKLRKKFKGVNFLISRIMIVDIGPIKYYVEVEDKYYTKSFKFKGVYEPENIIKL